MNDLITGIYRVYDTVSGASFVGFSHNVKGTIKRLRFELTLRACSYKPLQEFVNGCSDVGYEVLEELTFPEKMSEIEVDAHVKARMFAWREKLGEDTRLIQCQVV